MKRSLKNYFFPHPGNSYKPHFFRFPAVAITIVVLGGSGFLFSQVLKDLPKNNSYAAVYAGTVIAYTNQAREAVGDNDLVPNTLLAEAAQMKADDMAAKGYFAHNSPEGKTSWYWFDQVGYKYEYAGENLAINYSDSEEVTSAWLASPTHKANMLHPGFTEIGVATAVGMYNGRETTFVVQMFGKPVLAPLPAQKPLTKPVIKPVVETVATTVSAEAEEREVAGAYASDISTVGKVVTSPKKTVLSLYYIFIALVTLLLFGAAVFEFKKHHKSIWLAGGLLILVAGAIASFIVQSSQGMIAF